MKICLLGEFRGNLDEAARKISFYISKELSKRHEILSLDLREILSITFWKNLKKFDPQIIHYIHGGSLRSFMLLKIFSLYCKKAKTVSSVMRLSLPLNSKKMFHLIKPNLILAQSNTVEEIFRNFGCMVFFFPIGGVNIEKFTPITLKAKEKLREKYRIEKDKFVILHVGSLREGRNVQLLRMIQGKDNQMLIVSAVSLGFQKQIFHKLKEAGCIVWLKYFENIEEIYSFSDCYVFPVSQKKDIFGREIASSIEMPLSVIEAMACNLPVITTKFGALLRIFEEGNGVIFVDKEDEFCDALEKLKNNNIDIKTREKVLPYSWENVVKRLDEIYERLLRE